MHSFQHGKLVPLSDQRGKLETVQYPPCACYIHIMSFTFSQPCEMAISVPLLDGTQMLKSLNSILQALGSPGRVLS